MKNMKAKTMKTLHCLVAGLRPSSSILARWIAFPLLFLGAGLTLVQPCAGAPFQFEATGSLHTARYYHTATLLPNGKVLVAGGYTTQSRSREAELYDPASGTWTTTGSLATARLDHTATLLPNGKVLVAGGLDSNSSSLASAELYDPASGKWTATGSLVTARADHTATLLPNGKVLVAGGYNGVIASREHGTLRPSERDLDGHRQPRHCTLYTRRRCCPTARCLSQEEKPKLKAILLRARNSTIRRAGLDGTGSLDTARISTRRRCCPTARCSSQAVSTQRFRFSRARNSTIRRAGLGRSPAASTPDAITTRRRCCPTARCSSRADMT